MRGCLNFSKSSKCHYCGRGMLDPRNAKTPMEKSLSATEDHKIPRNLGGSNDRDNLVIACGRCNHIKASIPYTIFKVFSDMVLRAFPDLPTPLLRNTLNRYIMHLLENAVENKKAMRDASTIAMLKLKDEIDRFQKEN